MIISSLKFKAPRAPAQRTRRMSAAAAHASCCVDVSQACDTMNDLVREHLRCESTERLELSERTPSVRATLAPVCQRSGHAGAVLLQSLSLHAIQRNARPCRRHGSAYTLSSSNNTARIILAARRAIAASTAALPQAPRQNGHRSIGLSHDRRGLPGMSAAVVGKAREIKIVGNEAAGPRRIDHLLDKGTPLHSTDEPRLATRPQPQGERGPTACNMRRFANAYAH
jgi:hypothetical protein